MSGVEAAPRGEAWVSPLRARLLSVARRRVPEAVTEDLVQDVLRILAEKGFRGPGGGDVEGAPPLAYAFRVLRNVIGNYYQRERVRGRVHLPAEAGAGAPDTAPTPLEALEADDALRRVAECLARLAADDGACGRYLSRLAEGATPRDLAHAEDVPEAVLYRRLYRCRLKLRALLAARGIHA